MPRLQQLCSTRFCQAAKLLLVGFTFSTASSLHAVSPTLIDLGVNETSALQLTTGVDYLLMINNDNPHGTSFYFGEFAQSVLTHYLQGAASVSQDNIDVPANAKVLWLLSPTKAGEYVYYAVNGSSDQKGDKGKITVKLAEGTNTATQAQVEPTTITAQTSPNAKPGNAQKDTLVINEQRRWLKGGRRD